MPKSMVIAPEQVRRGGWLETPPIPLNQYQADPQAERERWRVLDASMGADEVAAGAWAEVYRAATS